MEVKPLEKFHKEKQALFGRHSKCKDCRKPMSQKHYATVSLERRTLQRAKSRAIQKGVPFSLTIDDIIIPEYCPILKTKLEQGDKIHNDNSPSLDRLIPSLGYVPGNVTVISYKANRIKNDATPEELKAIVAWVCGA